LARPSGLANDHIISKIPGAPWTDLTRGDLPFAFLPALRPKPSLIGGHGQGRAQLKDAVVAFGDLRLCAGFIQMQSAPDFGRQRHNAAGLHRVSLNAEVCRSERLSPPVVSGRRDRDDWGLALFAVNPR